MKTIFFLILLLSSSAFAAESTPIELEGVGIEEHLGTTLTLSRSFVDEEGKAVALQDYFDGVHPVLMALVYYECPNLCTFVLNGLTSSLAGLPWTPGKEFRVVTVSIDPNEGPAIAKQKKAAYLEALKRPAAAAGWHFLTGREEEIRALADEIGFRYRYDDTQKQYAHASAIYALTPTGKLSRYLFGIEYPARQVRLALLEAAEGKIGNIVDKLLLYCYHYDPQGRRYAIVAMNLMKVAGAATVAGLMVLILGLMIRGRRRTNV